MLIYFIIQIIIAIILTETLTELAVKSEIFKPIRKLFSFWSWTDKLFNCGYCFSVWIAAGVVFLTGTSYPLTQVLWLDVSLMALVIHRLSNYLHNFNDKFLDKYYDIRFISTDKDS